MTGLVRFDLSSVPSTFTGANVAKATLKLYVSAVTAPGSFNVDFVTGSWTEKTVNANTEPTIGSAIVSNVNLAAVNKGDYVLIDVTPALVAWLNGTETNNGLALVANSPLNASFDSKENTGASHPPELDVVFTGASGGIAGVTTAAGSGLIGGGTSGTLNLSLTNTCATNQVLRWNGTAWACASVSGGGTITGVTAGTDLTGGGATGKVTLNLDITKVPQLATANTFTGNQTVNGNLSATGPVSANSFQIGSNLFDSGDFVRSNAFLGFASNPTTTGTFNLATGGQALQANTTGSHNVTYGFESLLHNTTGNQNVAYGVSALINNTTGSNNTAIGLGALGSNTTGSGNIAIGFETANTFATGSNNTFIGFNAGANTTDVPGLTNATAIGANSGAFQSNTLTLGGIQQNSVTVAIGNFVPDHTFALDIDTQSSNGTLTNGVRVSALSPGNLFLGLGNNFHVFRVDTSGVVFADGGFQASGADFAESVAVRGQRSQYEPGDVLEIDQTSNRHLALSHHAYATLVAGIYSTKPGMLATPHHMDDPALHSSEVPLAVMGIVPCKVTAENGPIKPGDLLVTSSRPGYAMKGTDRRRMLGAVVGKALEPLHRGTGMIEVLVTLQ